MATKMSSNAHLPVLYVLLLLLLLACLTRCIACVSDDHSLYNRSPPPPPSSQRPSLTAQQPPSIANAEDRDAFWDELLRDELAVATLLSLDRSASPSVQQHKKGVGEAADTTADKDAGNQVESSNKRPREDNASELARESGQGTNKPGPPTVFHRNTRLALRKMRWRQDPKALAEYAQAFQVFERHRAVKEGNPNRQYDSYPFQLSFEEILHLGEEGSRFYNALLTKYQNAARIRPSTKRNRGSQSQQIPRAVEAPIYLDEADFYTAAIGARGTRSPLQKVYRALRDKLKGIASGKRVGTAFTRADLNMVLALTKGQEARKGTEAILDTFLAQVPTILRAWQEDVLMQYTDAHLWPPIDQAVIDRIKQWLSRHAYYYIQEGDKLTLAARYISPDKKKKQRAAADDNSNKKQKATVSAENNKRKTAASDDRHSKQKEAALTLSKMSRF